MLDKEQRMSQILQRTRNAFKQDTAGKMEQVARSITQWENGEIERGLLLDSIYMNVHGIKGLALTLSYEDIHTICEQIDTAIIHQENREWTTEQIEFVLKSVEQLQAYVNEMLIDQ